jgi:hypothetical protein
MVDDPRVIRLGAYFRVADDPTGTQKFVRQAPNSRLCDCVWRKPRTDRRSFSDQVQGAPIRQGTRCLSLRAAGSED